ncbi:MAG: hypothetical protein ACYS76_11185 [Planctomycetota bacterium]|jgi:hypothetical protein
MNKNAILMILTICFLTGGRAAAKQPPSLEESAAEPIKYVGREQTDKRFYDGGLRHAVGVHCYQAYRANRTNPPEGGLIGWTYSHQPYLAYWNNRFYLQYLSDLREEHVPPGRTLVMTSKDGRNWSNPRVVFPEYVLPEIRDGDVHVPAGMFAVMHQRMGFYAAPNGRLLTLAFYAYCPTPKHSPNNGKGLGRVVREVYRDGSFGPIYFIRYNRHAGWNESNTRYPFYKESKEKAFVEACYALLNDKLMTLQWWEEDRAEDGFYTIRLKEGFQAKAFSYCHRPDGAVLGTWKRSWSALSPDNGQTWTEVVRCNTLNTTGAKTWIQRTEDGRYALVYDHSATKRNRFPLTVMTSDDCHEFDNLLCLTGEVPPQRYQGFHKDLGVQYVRGIVEGNGDPPGRHMWNTYSVNKEDIWVSRTRVPIRLWNLYVPKWAPISIVDDPKKNGNKCLELRDEEPHDYALAERIFPKSRKVTVDFRVLMQQVGHGVLCFEVHDGRGRRPMRLRFFPEWLWVDRGRVELRPVPISKGKWLDIRLKLDCGSQKYDLAVNGDWVKRDIKFAEEVETLERLVFRTGPWRGYVPPLTVDREPAPGMHQEDLAGSDYRVPLSTYLIDDVRTKPR